MTLVCHFVIGLRIVIEDHHEYQDKEEGSGCAHGQGQGHYFDYIEVDDEDYYEGGSAAFENNDNLEDYVKKGPPVFTDIDQNADEGKQVEAKAETILKITNDKDKIKETNIRIIPENLIIKNETHGNINGEIVITNKGHSTTIIDLIIEDDDTNKDADEEINIVMLKDVRHQSCSTRLVIERLVICLCIFYLYK